MKKIGFILSLFICMSVSTNINAETKQSKPVNIVKTAEVNKPKLLAVKFYADWCGTCKQLDPGLNKVISKFEDKPVLFVTMDLTDDFRTNQSKMLANSLGFGKIFKENQGTGFVLLLDPVKFKVLGQIDPSQTPAEMIKKVDIAFSKV